MHTGSQHIRKLTAKKLYEAIIENEIPSRCDLESCFPDTELDIVSIVDEWWSVVDKMSEIRKRVRKLAKQESDVL